MLKDKILNRLKENGITATIKKDYGGKLIISIYDYKGDPNKVYGLVEKVINEHWFKRDYEIKFKEREKRKYTKLSKEQLKQIENDYYEYVQEEMQKAYDSLPKRNMVVEMEYPDENKKYLIDDFHYCGGVWLVTNDIGFAKSLSKLDFLEIFKLSKGYAIVVRVNGRGKSYFDGDFERGIKYYQVLCDYLNKYAEIELISWLD